MEKFPSSQSNLPEAPKKLGYKERILDPESAEFKQFYEFLETSFEPGELEPFDRYKEELGYKDPNARVFCLVARDDKGNIISAAYGSRIESGEILAIRFLITKDDWRGRNVSQALDESLSSAALKFGEVNSVIGEAVDKSESYWNRLFLEKGNPMRRLYYSCPDSFNADFSKEVFYRLPPFEWNKDGTPVADPHQSEHLQAAVRGYKDKIPVHELEKILRVLWQKWYIRPRENFESDQAFEKHRNYVMDILENEIIKSLKNSKQDFAMTPDCVIPATREEREEAERKSIAQRA
jgi:hypothetical protein